MGNVVRSPEMRNGSNPRAQPSSLAPSPVHAAVAPLAAAASMKPNIGGSVATRSTPSASRMGTTRYSNLPVERYRTTCWG